MQNEYGVALDRNNYAPSVVEQGDGCYLCGRTDRKMERHEVFHGPYRDKSKRLGCWVNLCSECHDKLHHRGGGMDVGLKMRIQEEAMKHYGWTTEEFRERFGKNYV